MRKIAVANRKGGVGKTTLAVHLTGMRGRIVERMEASRLETDLLPFHYVADRAPVELGDGAVQLDFYRHRWDPIVDVRYELHRIVSWS